MPGLGSQIDGYLVLASLAGMLASFVMLGLCFIVWIRSMRTDLSVHAPLVDGPERH